MASLEANYNATVIGDEEIHRYLVIFNISKKHNVTSLVYTALGFGFVPIVVGLVELIKSVKVKEFLYFATFPELELFLSQRNVPLIAIEISSSSRSILDNPYTKSIAFMPGNEGSGLNSTQRRAANGFIYIPQYGTGTASLNVTVATSIVLHHYSGWTTESMGVYNSAAVAIDGLEATTSNLIEPAPYTGIDGDG